jgi:hypothetical protein
MKQNKYLRLLVIAAMVFSLQSCLKNNSFYTDFSKGNPAVELPLAATFTNEPFAVSFDVSTTPTTYYAVVNVASVNKPTSPVTATLTVDAAYLDSYNAAQDAAAKKAQADYLAADPNNTVDDSGYPADYVPYELMPDSTYSIPSLEATIAPGHREDSVAIQIFTDKIAAGHVYLLPISIAKSSLPISNWNHLMINIGAKNAYDGVYSVVDGNVQRYSNPTTPTTGDPLNGSLAGNPDMTLVTAGISSVELNNLRWHGGTSGVAGIDHLQAIVDPNTNKVTMISLGNPSLTNIPGKENSYDPATKTFTLNFYWNPTANKREITNLVLKYKKPR